MRLPSSIYDINQLPEPEKHAVYSQLFPGWLLEQLEIDPVTYVRGEHKAVFFRCPAGSRSLELEIKRSPSDRDPILYFHMADTFNQRIFVLLVIINDLDAPRYNIDIDPCGNPTQLGTTGRNVPAEIAAMQHGLAPGQVRQGLRAFRSLVPVFEGFVERMGHHIFLIEPLAYHNAIVFERYGFNYVRGLDEMHRIHLEFQPGGALHRKLTPENPFRQPDAWKTVRGRSWAIHDGILGYPYTGFQMYKRIGHHAGIETFPGSEW